MATARVQTRVRVAFKCPRCGRELERTGRTIVDKVINVVFTVRRYKCMGCFWEGLRHHHEN